MSLVYQNGKFQIPIKSENFILEILHMTLTEVLSVSRKMLILLRIE